MKKIIITAMLSVLFVTTSNAQEDSGSTTNQQFGLRAGYSSFIAKAKVDGASGSDNVGGFYIGAFAQFELSDKFDLQPELNFANYSQDGESSSVLLIPILAKFKPNDELGIYAGPQFDYLLNEEDAEGLKRLGLALAVGASYDVSEEVFIDFRYAFGLTDRLDGDLEGFEDFGIKVRLNYLQVGLGYRF